MVLNYILVGCPWRLLYWSETLLNFTDPVARNVYPTASVLTFNSSDSLSASNSVSSSLIHARFLDKRFTRKSSLVSGSRIVHELYHFQNVLFHLLLWAYHQQRLHLYFWNSYAPTEDRFLIALSRFEHLIMYSAEVRWPILRIHLFYILRTRWIRQSTICTRRKNQGHFITGLCHRQPSKNITIGVHLILVEATRPRINHWQSLFSWVKF